MEATEEGINEAMVSFVSRRYMRGENESLVVCLSQCLHLYNLYSVYTQSILSLASVLLFSEYRRCGPSGTIQYRKQNVEILELYVEIQKSKNELFKISYILIYLGTF